MKEYNAHSVPIWQRVAYGLRCPLPPLTHGQRGMDGSIGLPVAPPPFGPDLGQRAAVLGQGSAPAHQLAIFIDRWDVHLQKQ